MELNVAIVQTDIEWGNIDANIKAADVIVRQLQGCDLVVFPEMFTIPEIQLEKISTVVLVSHGCVMLLLQEEWLLQEPSL